MPPAQIDVTNMDLTFLALHGFSGNAFIHQVFLGFFHVIHQLVHAAITRFTSAWELPVLAALAIIPSPTSFDPVKAI